MTVVIRFNTSIFDVSAEQPNPINPIAGESLLSWLKAKLDKGHSVTKPEAEDWGWYCHLDWDGTNYMLGSSASEADGGEPEWILQIIPSRSLKQRLLGQGKIDAKDSCVVHILGLLSAEPGFHALQVESAA